MSRAIKRDIERSETISVGQNINKAVFDEFKDFSKSEEIYRTVGSLSFRHWHQLISMPAADFNSVMIPPARFLTVPHLPHRRIDQNWDWIDFTTSIIRQDKFSLFEKHNARIYHLAPDFDESVLSYDTWTQLVLLPERDFEQELQRLKSENEEKLRRKNGEKAAKQWHTNDVKTAIDIYYP